MGCSSQPAICRCMHCGLVLRWQEPPLFSTLLLNLQIRPDDAFGRQMLMNLEVRAAVKLYVSRHCTQPPWRSAP